MVVDVDVEGLAARGCRPPSSSGATAPCTAASSGSPPRN
jgi:hypothetical protein